MDRIHQPHPQPSPADDTVRALTLLVADRIAAVRPAEPITETDRTALCAELTDSEQPLHGQLLAATVVPHCTGSRAAYARALRAQVGVR